MHLFYNVYTYLYFEERERNKNWTDEKNSNPKYPSNLFNQKYSSNTINNSKSEWLNMYVCVCATFVSKKIHDHSHYTYKKILTLHYEINNIEICLQNIYAFVFFFLQNISFTALFFLHSVWKDGTEGDRVIHSRFHINFWKWKNACFWCTIKEEKGNKKKVRSRSLRHM